eukprot:15382288-Alexandrium_andersonii.AAC.1
MPAKKKPRIANAGNPDVAATVDEAWGSGRLPTVNVAKPDPLEQHLREPAICPGPDYLEKLIQRF